MAEQLDIGPDTPGRGPRRWLLAVAGLVVIGLLIAYGIHTRDGVGKNAAQRSPTAPTPGSPQPSTSAPPRSPTVTELDDPLLPGAQPGWELFARTGHGMQGPGHMLRIELARGRITRTPIPRLQSGGPVSFVAGRTNALVRPSDAVTGYRVPDGKPARKLTGALAHSGSAIPGPEAGEVWIEHGGAMRLVRMDEKPLGTSMKVPLRNQAQFADGDGYLLVNTEHHGSYDIRPSGRKRITAGTTVAVGPTRWLVQPKNARNRCKLRVVNRSTDHRRCLSPTRRQHRHRDYARINNPASMGTISPDGRTAALADGSGKHTVRFVDLATGSTRSSHVSIPDGGLHQTAVWSPDSRWLFVIDGNHHLVAINQNTGKTHRFGHRFTKMFASEYVDQLAFRDADQE